MIITSQSHPVQFRRTADSSPDDRPGDGRPGDFAGDGHMRRLLNALGQLVWLELTIQRDHRRHDDRPTGHDNGSPTT
jgi:hypothetical protein